MQTQPTNALLRHLHQAVLRHDSDGLTDLQLLEAFRTWHEEAAFAALMRRHGPMVLGICRRILGNPHEAEDAFQATFLVLLCKASSIRPGQAVGPWLHGVAQRTARRARATLGRRRAALKRLWENARRGANASCAADDWRALLDEEVNRLPGKYRAPIVLCDLQGRTHREAAEELGWPQGTLSGRLWRARALLAQRLTRRGLAFSAAVLTLAYVEDAAFAGVTASLVQATMKAARVVREGETAAAGEVSARVAALTQGVLKAMWMTKVRMAAAVLLTLGFGMGVFLYAARTQAQPRDEKKTIIPPAGSIRAAASKLPEKLDDPVPTIRELLAYLNDNARRVEGLRASVNIDCRQGVWTIGLGGMLACQRPRDVRLQVKIFGQPAVELGCNEEEYWYWLSKAEPPVPCRGRRDEEARRGSRRWPMPYRPEWLLDVLGIAEYDPENKYSLQAGNEYLELSETLPSPQGQPLRKTILFNRLRKQNGSQVAAIVWENPNGKVLCRADIKKIYTDKETGARITQEALLTFPSERWEGRFVLENPQIGKLPADRAAIMFSPKSAPFAAKTAAEAEAKKKADTTAAIRIDLAKDNVQARCGEDVLKLSGQLDGKLALRALQEQLRVWMDKDTSALITCSADVDYARLKAILAACRAAGLRVLEVRAGCRAAPD